MEKFKVRRPNVPEGCPEVTVRESPDELTLRAEEVGTLKTYINGRAFGPTWIRWIVCACAQRPSGKYGPHSELFFFLILKEPRIVLDSETFSPFINSRPPFLR